MKKAGRRGFTLVELVVTVAVASVVIMAVVASGVTMVQFTQGQGRRTAAETQLALALSQIERRASNAGVNFANARYAVRFHNNVVGTVPNYDGSTTPVVPRCDVAPCPGFAEGIVEGTDVLELAMSNSGVRRGGEVIGSGRPGVSPTETVRLSNGDPFLESELMGAGGQLVLFSDPRFPEDACLARFLKVPNPAIPFELEFEFLNDDLGTANVPCIAATDDTGAPLPGVGSPCPCRAGFDVYVLEERSRLVIYQRADGEDIGLYLQQPAGAGSFGNVFIPVALGIENLQVSPVVGARLVRDAVLSTDTDLVVDACTATALTAGAPNWSPCQCNDSLAATCTLGDATPGAAEAYVRSVAIELTARADRWQEGQRPASFDSPAGPVDGVNRMRASMVVNIANPFLPLQ